MTITLSALQKQRRDSAANWTAENPTLLAGEIGIESDTGYWKVGDGSTAWTSLAYVSGLGAEIPVDRLADGAARQLLQTDAAGTGVEWTNNVDVPGTLDVTSTATFDSIASHPLGSAGAPTITFTGDPNTGIYSPGADQLAISTNGTGRLFVDASGNVGIASSPATERLSIAVASAFVRVDSDSTYGTTSPYIELNRPSATSYRIINALGVLRINQLDASSVATELYRYSSNNHTFLNGTSELARITSDGKLGLGTSSPNSLLSVINGAVETNRFFYNRISSATAIADRGIRFEIDGTDHGRIYSPNGKSVAIQAGNGTLTDAVTVDQSGRVGIGTTSPDEKLEVVGNIKLSETSTTLIFEDSDSTNLTINRFQSYDGALIADVDPSNNGSSASSFRVNVDGSERARIDSSGRLLVGTSTAFGSGVLQVTGGGCNIGTYTNNAFSSGFAFIKSRSTTPGQFTVVQSGDELGGVVFQGTDGAAIKTAATIYGVVDATPGANDMPGRLVFSTTADGASTPTERARITNGGYFKASNTGTYTNAAANYHEKYSTSNDVNTLFRNTNGSLSNPMLYVAADRAASNAYSFLNAYSSFGGAVDLEFSLYGDGNGKCDGSWTGGGADYAEYFEWGDSNPDADDRRGIAVVLDGDKIRPAEAGEDPIGVISGNPSVVGDAAWNKWSGKYLRDEYGTYILEDYEVEDEDGNTVIQQRRKLNPAYDPDVEYISREQRPEWDCVGLMGKLRLRKGQPTGSRWIKMRDISDSVEEWLVR